MKRDFRSVAAAAAAALTLAVVMSLAGCAAPPPPPPTIAQVKITATADVNANPAGQGAPVVLRVYQLASPTGFQQAEFFSLLNTDAATLGADLVKKDEFLLVPGATRETTLTVPDSVHAIGLFAPYREFQHVTWRAVAALPAHKTTTLAVTASASGLRLTPAP